MLSILKLDAGGIPQGWVNAEEATKHYADKSVLWTLGDPIMKMRGGISRASGLQSVIELHSIIAIKGSGLEVDPSVNFEFLNPRIVIIFIQLAHIDEGVTEVRGRVAGGNIS